MRHDILSDVLSTLKNGDSVGKTHAVTPSSKMVKEILMIIQKAKYIGSFEYIDDNKGGKFRVELLGKINSCGSIRPRSSVKTDSFEKWERRFLPASGIGIIILTTSKGIMTHKEAISKKIGGSLLAYIY